MTPKIIVCRRLSCAGAAHYGGAGQQESARTRESISKKLRRHSTRSVRTAVFDCTGRGSACIECPDCGLRFVPTGACVQQIKRMLAKQSKPPTKQSMNLTVRKHIFFGFRFRRSLLLLA